MRFITYNEQRSLCKANYFVVITLNNKLNKYSLFYTKSFNNYYHEIDQSIIYQIFVAYH